MNSDVTLLEKFVAQELDHSVRSILRKAFDDRARSKNILFRELDFNCFDVLLDFEKGMVTLQDVLSAGESSVIDIPMLDFMSACGLSISSDF